MDDFEKITAVLDRDYPDWWLKWADAADLINLAKLRTTEKTLKNQHIYCFLQPVINAALSAGVVKLAE